MNDARTIGEAYSSATESSDLRMRTESRGDVDRLIAAGWIADGFATSLYRLRAEFDAVKGEHEQAEEQLVRQLDLAKEVQRSAPARSPGPELPAARDDRLAAPSVRADAIRKQARTDALTARLFVLAHMKTLSKARDQLGAFALGLAYGRKCNLNPDQVLALAGKVLEVFLDPNCHHCDGRGKNGGSHRGEPEVLCKPCRATGRRREEIGKTTEERAFAARLGLRLDMTFSEVDRLMRAYLRTH